MLNYQDAITYLNNHITFGIKLGLENMNKILAYLNFSFDDIKIIHLAGTNGKGSTSAFIASALENCNYKVGLYSSPFLVELEERWQINKCNMKKNALCKYLAVLQEAEKSLNINISYFEITTLVAFLYFKEEKCDYIVLETGMGGRLDATNVVKAHLGIICTIGKDHCQYLGESIAQITKEKAGIIKDDYRVVIANQDSSITKIIEERCTETNSTFFYPKKLKLNQIIFANDRFKYQEFLYKDYKILCPLAGIHQEINLATAVCVLEQLNLDLSLALEGIQNCQWQGRMQHLDNGWIVDGAHNLQAFLSLKNSLKMLYPQKKFTVVLSFMQDKEIEEIIPLLDDIAIRVFTIQVSSRGYDAFKLADEIKSKLPNLRVEAKNSFQSCLPLEKNSLICGSLYLVGEVLSFLQK